MTGTPDDPQTVIGHLEEALENAQNDHARYHIREALQYLVGDLDRD